VISETDRLREEEKPLTKTYLITGASSGFGAELAKAALQRGEKVVGAARRKEALDGLIEGYADNALAVTMEYMSAGPRCLRGIERLSLSHP